jgi:murein DD-endopeptidase MepM/ murein hydrolase activator NlpD
LPKRKKIYYYNDHSLAFEEILVSRKKKVKDFLFFTVVILCISGITGYLFYHYVLAPEKIVLAKKNAALQSDMDRLAASCDSLGNLLAGTYFAHDNYYRIILGIDTLPVTIRTAGTGGTLPTMAFFRETSHSHDVKRKINQLKSQTNIQLNSLEMLQEAAVQKEKKYNAIPAIQPIAQNDLIMVSSFFGMRFDPFMHEEADHCGLDFVAPVGTEVYATGEGNVTLLKFSRTGYGNELVINHSFGYSTRYAHLEKFFVSEGEWVKRGQLIGLVGNSGRSTGPHLHYEVRYEGRPVNPVFYYSDDLTDNEFHLLTNKTN